MKNCLRGDWPLTRYVVHRAQPCSPSGPRHSSTLEPSDGWGQEDRIGGKDTHWSSVLNFLLHLPLALPSLLSVPFPSCPHIRLWGTSPRSCIFFLTYFSCLLCENSSQANPASPEPESLLDSVDVQSFTPVRVSEKWEEVCLSKRGVMGPEGTSQLPCKPGSACFPTCLERCYINDRISSMATFCYAKSLLPCWCLC